MKKKKKNKINALTRSNTESNINPLGIKLIFCFSSGRKISKIVFRTENIVKLEEIKKNFIFEKKYMTSNETFYYNGKEINISSNLTFEDFFSFELQLRSQKEIIIKEKQQLNNSFFKQIKPSLVSDKLKNIPNKFFQYLDAKKPFTILEENKSKTIMVFGKTGEGKTSFINGLINYVNEVNFYSKERFLVINEKTGREDTESQTSDIQIFNIHSINKDIPPIKIIDTPGFSDTRGIELDERTTKLIDNFLISKKISKINNIFFFINSTYPRLTPEVKYTYHTILNLFPKTFIEKISFIFTKNGDEAIIQNILHSFEGNDSGFQNVYFKIKQQKPYYFHLSQDLLKVDNEEDWNELMKSFKSIIEKINTSQDLYLNNFQLYSNLKKRYNLFIDDILNLDDFIKDKIINELEKVKKQITNTEISVNKSCNYKSVDEIIECVDCSSGLVNEIAYQCMICAGNRPSCKVSTKRETTILPGTKHCSVCKHDESQHAFTTKKYIKKKIEKILYGVKDMYEKFKNELNQLKIKKNSLELKKKEYEYNRKLILAQAKYSKYSLRNYDINHRNEKNYIQYFNELIKEEELKKDENSGKIINFYENHLTKFKLMEEVENSYDIPYSKNNLLNIPFTKNDETHNFILFSNNLELKNNFVLNLLKSLVEELSDEEKKNIKTEIVNENWKHLNIRAYTMEKNFQIYISKHIKNVNDILTMLKEIENISIKTIIFLFEECSLNLYFKIFSSFMERILNNIFIYDKILIIFYNNSNKLSSLSVNIYNKEQILNKIESSFMFSIDRFSGMSGFKRNIEFNELLNIIIQFNNFEVSNFLIDLF